MLEHSTAPEVTATVYRAAGQPASIMKTAGARRDRVTSPYPSRRGCGHAPKAVEHLRTAIDTYGDNYARARAMNLPGLAGAYFQVGDLDTAVATGHQAVTEIGALSSTRIHGRLRTLAEVIQPYGHRSDVAELRRRIHRTVTTVA